MGKIYILMVALVVASAAMVASTAQASHVGCYDVCGEQCDKVNGVCPTACPYGHWSDAPSAPGCPKRPNAPHTLDAALDDNLNGDLDAAVADDLTAAPAAD